MKNCRIRWWGIRNVSMHREGYTSVLARVVRVGLTGKVTFGQTLMR
jgi:hypothetical protein